MALSAFGPSIDLHAGGADLAFPHHAYEAAQAEAFTGVAPFARAWMHVGSVMVDGRKMAKSARNLVFVNDLLERWPSGAVRLLILSRPWREPWEFDETQLERAAAELEGLWHYDPKPGVTEAARVEVRRALLDDLDVARAVRIAREAGGQVQRDLVSFLGLN